MRIFLKTSKHKIPIVLNQSSQAKSLYNILPVSSKASLWGKEIYFDIPSLDYDKDSLTLSVSIGDVAYWPQGSCFCLFFGPTPISKDDQPLPYSEVVILGKVESDLPSLEDIQPQEEVELVVAS
jgi:hypothetical protein